MTRVPQPPGQGQVRTAVAELRAGQDRRGEWAQLGFVGAVEGAQGEQVGQIGNVVRMQVGEEDRAQIVQRAIVGVLPVTELCFA